MKTETVVITPEMAKEWLKLNTRNRKLDLCNVSRFANDMRTGNWKLNGETIKINHDGLIDGQTRLNACIKADTPFVSLVVRDVSFDVFDTIDRGKTRTPGDIFSIMGEKNATGLASAMAFVCLYSSGRSVAGGGGEMRPTAAELEEKLHEYPEARDAVSFLSGLKLARSLLNPGVSAGIATLMWRIDENLCRAFWKDLNDQTNIFQPVTKLRERLFANKMAKAKLHRGHLAALVIKAWNAVRDGKDIGSLRALEKDEKIPMIK